MAINGLSRCSKIISFEIRNTILRTIKTTERDIKHFKLTKVTQLHEISNLESVLKFKNVIKSRFVEILD